jgi:penicillin-binding protein 2
MSIGQGALTASPLQMAMVAATIANGGTLYRPRLVKKWRTAPGEEYRKNPSWAIRRIDVPIEALDQVRNGMHDVVMNEDGTAKKARVAGIEIAGKTGSAQYKKKVGDEVVNSVHTWMISYAPFDFPRYAVAILVEDGVSGGSTVGPRLSALYQKIFEYDGSLAKEEG